MRYIDKDGVEQTAEGNLPFINQQAIMKYLSRKFRPLSVNGLFKELNVTEVATSQPRRDQTIVAAAVSSVMTTLARPPVVQERMALCTPTPPPVVEKEKFDKKSCFVYRFMGQVETNESKQHKFYEVVPHY